MDHFFCRYQQFFSKKILSFTILNIILFILFGIIRSYRQGVITTFFFVYILLLTLCIAMYSVGDINIKQISSVLDPKLWLPLSYVIYFVVLPCLSILFDSKYSMYNDEITEVMLSTLLGIIALHFGLNIFKSQPKSMLKAISINKFTVASLLIFTVIIQLYYWYWRIENGFFFTHAVNYIPEANIETGIRDILGESVTCIPLVILAFNYRNMVIRKKIVLYLFVIYTTILLMLYILSGQIRSFLLFFLMTLVLSAYMSGKKRLSWRSIGMITTLFLTGVIFFIYMLRYSAEIIIDTENQFTYILYNVPDIIGTALENKEDNFAMKQLIQDRIFSTQVFLLDTVRALNENSSYGYGSYTMRNLPIVFPRLLWPGKGQIEDTEEIIQRDVFNTSPIDLSLAPLAQFYAEGGIPGILIGFFLFGLVASFAHKVCFSINNIIGGIVCWVVILGSILQLENNIPIALLLGIRNGLMLLLFSSIVSVFSKNISVR